MNIEHPHAQAPTPEELHDLERLRLTIERVVADGKVSGTEIRIIQAVYMADGKITVDELCLYRTLVLEKIEAGELEYEW